MPPFQSLLIRSAYQHYVGMMLESIVFGVELITLAVDQLKIIEYMRVAKEKQKKWRDRHR